MEDNNVTDLDVYKLASLIADNWLDSYSDNGAIWEASKKRLEAIRANVDPERWQAAVDLAQRRWGQQ